MDIHTVYILSTGGLLLLLILMELCLPARTYATTTKKNSYRTNAFIFISNNVITFLLQISAVFAFVTTYTPTVTYFSSLSIGVQVVLGVLILDFSIWLWHRLNHILPILWMFHKAHHSERYLNASSALRFYIGELLLSVVWKSMVLILFGIPLWVFLFSEFLLTFFAVFHHANIQLPKKVHNIIEWIIITPYLHRVHHSEIRREHDTNYGVILSVWDRLFGTLHSAQPKKIGLKHVPDKNIFTFLLFPFQKNKDTYCVLYIITMQQNMKGDIHQSRT